MSHPAHAAQRGAALLLAMLTVALVATLSSAALWQQWSALSIESAERQRLQASWILGGALDWARLILREDSVANRRNRVDHLAEPWAMPLAEARLSSFLAVDQNQSADLNLEAFLSGEMHDLQGKLNVFNLVTLNASGQAQASEADVLAFQRLFEQLGLPAGELARCIAALQAAADRTAAGRQRPDAPLLPERWGQLGWLGLSPATLRALAPHATWLPRASNEMGQPTPLNLNTASAEALYAALPDADMALARQMVAQREGQHFKDLADVRQRFPRLADSLAEGRFKTSSRYFEVRGRLRLEDTVIEELSLVDRGEDTGVQVQTLWRERRPPQAPVPARVDSPTRSLQ